MNDIIISNKKIGIKHPCFIIAEAGLNHNGDPKLAKRLIDEAVEAGADAIKFQTFKSEGLVTRHAKIADYQKQNISKNITQFEMIKNLELKYNDFIFLKNYCDKKGIIFLSTPHSFDAIDFLDNLVPAFKFGSGDLTNIPTLEYASKKGKPIILGTGMSTLQEVKDAVNAVRKNGNEKIIALHCTTNYPASFEEVNINAMKNMKNELDCLVGYSDHTMGITVPIMAITLGAVIIEKHFTLDKNLPGPDHKASLEPSELKKMVSEIRNVEKALGSFEKKPTDSEKKIMKNIRKSIVSKVTIKKGEIIRMELIEFKRPATGISPKELDKVLGKRTIREIKKDTPILKKDVE